MKRFLLSIMLCTALVAFGGCEKKPQPNQGGNNNNTETPDKPDKPDTPDKPDKPDEPDNTPYFKATVKDLYANNCGSESSHPSFEIVYETNVKDWTVTSEADWCKVTKEATRILVVLEPYLPAYPSGQYMLVEPRTCKVTIDVGTVFKKTFEVLQESKTGITSPDGPVKISAAGGTVDVTLPNNCYDWTAKIDKSLSPDDDGTWLSFEKIDNITLRIKASARPSNKAPRDAWVLVESVLDPKWGDMRGTYGRIHVLDADANLSGEDYGYGDPIDWD